MPSRRLGLLLGLLTLAPVIPAPADAAPLVVCSAIGPLDGSTVDVTPTLEACVRETDPGGALEIPPGKYTISRTWRIPKSITVRTQGKTATMPSCDYIEAADCAEFVLRSNDCVMVALDAAVTMHHVVVNGNKYERLGSLIHSPTHRTTIRGGLEMTSGSRLLSSVVKYVACRASLVVARGATDVVIARNTVAFNGFHHANWADGITVNNAYNATVTDNFLIDNTDIQMIFGGCRGCTIRNNEFRHSPSFSGASFAALMLSAMVIEGGDFDGTHVSNNRIDCGPQKRCGFGIYYGNEAWNTLETLIRGASEGWRLGGGAIYDNHISNAQTGLNLGRTTSVVTVHDNTVESSGGLFTARCGSTFVTRTNSAYNIIPGAILDRSLDTVPTSAYTNHDWVNCVPNWTPAAYGPMDPSEAGVLSSIGAARVAITCPRTTLAGNSVTCTASGSGAILSGHWTVSNVPYAACNNQPTCAFVGLTAGDHAIQAVAQAPARVSSSNVSIVSVVSNPASTVSIWCPGSMPTGGTAQCIFDVDGIFGSSYWTVNGARLASCDNQPACTGLVLQPGSYDVNAVVQMAAGVVVSSTARISVTGVLPPLSATCAKTATCGPTAVCEALAAVPVTELFWLVNGSRYLPCDNQARCSGDDLPLGTYIVQAVGRTATGEVRSAPDSFTVP